MSKPVPVHAGSPRLVVQRVHCSPDRGVSPRAGRRWPSTASVLDALLQRVVISKRSQLIAAELAPSRAGSLAAEGLTADTQRLPDIRRANAVVGHEANQVRAVFSAEQPVVGARGQE